MSVCLIRLKQFVLVVVLLCGVKTVFAGQLPCFSKIFNKTLGRHELLFEQEVLHLSYEDLKLLKKEDFLKFNSSTILVNVNGISNQRQNVLALSNFSSQEQSLIKKILMLGRSEKFRRKWALNRYRDNAVSLENALTWHRGDISTAERFEILHDQINIPEVEVGAWRITLQTGEILTAIHTTGGASEIDGRVIVTAINEIFTKNNVSIHDLSKVQYFHNHPSHNNITSIFVSAADESNSHLVAEELKRMGADIPVEMHAISIIDESVITFQTIAN